MAIALYANQRGPVSAAIRWRTWSQYSHASWLPYGASGPVWEATYPEGVRHCDTLRETAKAGARVDVFDLPGMPGWQRNMVTEFFASQLGKQYDLRGILAFVSRRDTQDQDKWFCSEIVHAACTAAGLPLFGDNSRPWKTSPGMLLLSPKLVFRRSIEF